MIREPKQPHYFLISMSFLIAILLTIFPLPQELIWLWPQWIFVMVLFWVVTLPFSCGVVLAWSMGVIMDLITGTPLCVHALSFVILVYLILKINHYVTHLLRWQQATVIGIFVFLNNMIEGFILGMTGHTAHTGLMFQSVITTALIWPLLFKILRSNQRLW